MAPYALYKDGKLVGVTETEITPITLLHVKIDYHSADCIRRQLRRERQDAEANERFRRFAREWS